MADSHDRPDRRADLLEQIGMQVRRMGAQSVLLSQTVAARFGLHQTDLECLDLMIMRGEATAGEISRFVGLTSGATTAMIDRLERAGYVKRAADPRDRRRVIVRVQQNVLEPIGRVYEPIRQAMLDLWEKYDDAQLAVIADFLEKSVDLGVKQAEALGRAKAPPQQAGTSRA